jgi:hypothetical protein
MQVTSDCEGEEGPAVGTSGEKVGLTPHPKIQQVLEATATAVAASPSCHGEAGTPLKKAHTKGCMPPSARYAHVGCCTLPM